MIGAGKPAPFDTSWFPDWSGETACIIASGPSLTQSDVGAVRGLRRVVLNTSWLLAPDADVLYACDGRWWRRCEPGYGQDALKRFAGLMATQDEATCEQFGVHHAPLSRDSNGDPFITFERKPPLIGSGGNSGFQALNLVAHFGARRVILLGFDMSGGHWHGAHPSQEDANGAKGLNNPGSELFALWIQAFDRAAGDLREMGVEVVNASRKTALECFPRAAIEEIFGAHA